MPLEPPCSGRLPWRRATFGGFLMGLANLVPGISGGTMLLAAGVYGDFIDSVASVCRFRWQRRPLLVLLLIAAAAAVAILLFAGPVKEAVVDHRWLMYSLFVGLTLGGVPALYQLARPVDRTVLLGTAAGIIAMVLIAFVQRLDPAAGGEAAAGFFPLLFAGIAGASSMVLPGISGGYLLLVLGQYVRILTAVDQFGQAIGLGDPAAAIQPVVHVLLPVGIGLLIGVAGVSNLLRYLLRVHHKATLGVLLGLLLGAVVGLWPFQQSVPPGIGKPASPGTVAERASSDLTPEDWPVRIFRPTATQAAGAAMLIVLGAATTAAIAGFGNRRGRA